MSIYMQIPGIQGNVATKNYEGWIELLDLDFAGINTPTHMVVGKVSDRFNTQPSFGQVVALKGLDKSSPKLFEAAHSGQTFSQLNINYVTNGSSIFTYAKMQLSNAAITHYSERFNGDTSEPEELIRIAYTKIERTFIPRDKSNQAQSPIVSGFDLEQAQKL